MTNLGCHSSILMGIAAIANLHTVTLGRKTTTLHGVTLAEESVSSPLKLTVECHSYKTDWLLIAGTAYFN